MLEPLRTLDASSPGADCGRPRLVERGPSCRAWWPPSGWLLGCLASPLLYAGLSKGEDGPWGPRKGSEPHPLPEVCAVISRCAAPRASGTHLPTRTDGLWARERLANHHFAKPRSAQQAEEAEAWSWGAGLWVSVMPALASRWAPSRPGGCRPAQASLPSPSLPSAGCWRRPLPRDSNEGSPMALLTQHTT